MATDGIYKFTNPVFKINIRLTAKMRVLLPSENINGYTNPTYEYIGKLFNILWKNIFNISRVE